MGDGQVLDIDLVGFSRGGAVALAVANDLKYEGCCCEYNAKHECTKGYSNIPVRFLGMFDAVDANLTPNWPQTVPSNVGSSFHARRTGMLFFPTMRVPGTPIYRNGGGLTSHHEVGFPSDNLAMQLMLEAACKAEVPMLSSLATEGGALPHHTAAVGQ
jgi:hypothetical protein